MKFLTLFINVCLVPLLFGVLTSCNVAKSNDNNQLALMASARCSPVLMGGAFQGCPLDLSAIVSTIAGPAQGASTSGDVDDTSTAARFFTPSGITTDGTNLFLCDANNNKIKKIVIATGEVTTISGQGNANPGDTDGTGTAARFRNPRGITTDGTNLFVADMNNNKIRMIVIATGVVTTLAGPAQGTTTSGDNDGTGTNARFYNPWDITTDGTNLYVADWSNNKIRQIVISTGVVTTLAGPSQGDRTSGDTDATGNSARFRQPQGITTDGTNLFVSDSSNNKIRKIVISNGVVTTLAGPAQGTTTSGDADDTGAAAKFFGPANITTDGTNLYVADMYNNKIRMIVIATGVVTTLAGPAQGTTTSGDTDATGTAARFQNPCGITTDGTNVFVGDMSNNKIRKIL